MAGLKADIVRWSEELGFQQLGISPHNPQAPHSRRICCPAEFRDEIRGSGLLKPNPEKGKGIPQGSPISALLSNIYMLEFDDTLSTGITALGGLYRRYCDDIMIVVPPDHQQAAEELVNKATTGAKLVFNIDKTDRAAFPEGRGQTAITPTPESGLSERIQYLGFTYNGGTLPVYGPLKVRGFGFIDSGCHRVVNRLPERRPEAAA